MKLITQEELRSVLASQPIEKHMKFFDDPCFSGLGTVWYYNWLDGLNQYLQQRRLRNCSTS